MTDVARDASPGAWASALSTDDFAACVEAGLQPRGFVQGCSVVSWSFMGLGPFQGPTGLGSFQSGGYYEQYACPHGFVSAEHRLYGMNYEKTWVEAAWMTAYSGALARLVAEAKRLGAHGVIGVADRWTHHPENAAYECTLTGTAVGVEGVAPPGTPFTTFLAGQKLNKLIEAGYAPVAIALSLASIGVFASCVTEYQLRGGAWTWGAAPAGEIDQVTRAHEAARSAVREGVRRQLDGDSLHAAELVVASAETQDGPQIDATLRGNRVRRFKAFAELPPPRAVVRVVDE